MKRARAYRSCTLGLYIVCLPTAYVNRSEDKQSDDKAGAPTGLAGVHHLVCLSAPERWVFQRRRGAHARLRGRRRRLVGLVAHRDSACLFAFACCHRRLVRIPRWVRLTRRAIGTVPGTVAYQPIRQQRQPSGGGGGSSSSRRPIRQPDRSAWSLSADSWRINSKAAENLTRHTGQ